MFAVMNLAGYSAPEADDLRKAISKKLKEKLQKHRQKFIDGAVNNGIRAETASAIFDDWEEFARYGFNKSHAVDYGVIAVQTAYLKVHFPVEYMTALMSVSMGDTAKVALYVADCRRMEIAVEPPDINLSEWDFAIEDHPDGKSGIRFGLGAVKNVGQAPVEVILKARASGPFRDLNDFARRVDLRQVGKRSLECLVKVGAFDHYGPRLSLLDVLDRLVSVSSGHFRAIDSGQMSLFGAHTGVDEVITLPQGSGETSRREILNWERELIGLYVSDHPLSPVMDVLSKAVTHYSGQLSEASPQERVRVAGLITRVRHHQSKTGKPMAFVAIEDLQGTIELVIFPKTWDKYAEMIEYDRIVLVDGKVDLASAEPKVLVDQVTTEFDMLDGGIEPAASAGWVKPSRANQQMDKRQAIRVESFVQAASPGEQADPGADPGQNRIEPDEGIVQVGNKAELDNIPPPPDAFPGDWDDFLLVSESPEDVNLEAVFTTREVPSSESAPSTEPVLTEVSPAEQVVVEEQPRQFPSHPGQDESEHREHPPYLVSPLVAAAEDGTVSMITVVLRSTGDRTRDVLRLRRIHGIITSYPGTDRFAFHVFERGRGYLLEFPNYTVGLCPELLGRLGRIIGTENVRVEKITFQ